MFNPYLCQQGELGWGQKYQLLYYIIIKLIDTIIIKQLCSFSYINIS